MAELVDKSVTWDDGEFSEATSDPSVSIISEDVPTLTIAAILGVTVVVLVAIAIVFVLGILIDCRQKRLLDKKLGEVKVKRMKNHKRVNPHPDVDVVSIAHHMEEPEHTQPPACVLHHIP